MNRHLAARASAARPGQLAVEQAAALRAPAGISPALFLPSGPERELRGSVNLCQALGPAAPYPIRGVDASDTGGCGELHWQTARILFWQAFAQGEYVGHARTAHVPEYRLRVDDELEVVYRITREETSRPYELNVGDEIRVESFTDPNLNRSLVVQPDGTIVLPILNEVKATRRSVAQLREELQEQYRKYYNDPAITVLPIKVNTRLEDIRATVDSRQGLGGGQFRRARVTPEGTIQLPAIGNTFVQGMTLEEVQRELNHRYAQEVEGLEVTPVLVVRAPRYVYVLGEVAKPGRYDLTGPTTAMQAIAMAGSWTVGGNTRQIVVFRRGDDWRLLATMLDLRAALYGKKPTPADEIWLNDSDTIVVPKMPIKVVDEFIDLVFTQGIYGVVPFSFNYTFVEQSAVGGVVVAP
ncbi:MAG: polysaccharide biosynthesis/export family protein [Pirellulales bacterium]|nr:polysaccharide biosynthesis/export family protein [Pirellulales bacterium]